VLGDAGGDLLPFVCGHVGDGEVADLLSEIGEVAPEDSLPQPDRVVLSAGGDRAAVGRKSTLIAFSSPEELAGRRP
jgi:hypothetical protein